ncbi:MAG: family 10 glycosylhydrolase [Candidatus Omnitrophota bacterium]|nr:family 10 glycosylhydrolase [Candidatus Omnitrophota bacterium]
MKKKILFYILCILFIFPAQAKCEESLHRGLFVSLIQDPSVFSSREDIVRLIDFAKKFHIKILFVQVYRANKAWFPSKVADSRPYEACLKNLSEDPFALLVKQAHAAGIEVYAWFNLLSLSTNKDAKFLKKYGTEILTRNLKEKKTLEDYKIDGQYFLEPGDLRVREALLSIVEEVLRAYPKIDGVLFDYIRYPDKNPAYGYTKINVERFKKATGNKTIKEDGQLWKDWKRNQVTEFLKLLVKKTRVVHPDIQISATGCMPYSRAYYEAFQDWPLWLRYGLVDFVTIMTYSPYPAEFEKWISTAKTKVRDFKKVNIGVGAYKLVHSPETFGQEFKLCEKAGGNTCVVFHYGSFLENPTLSSFLTSNE